MPLNSELEGALELLKREWEQAEDWLDMAFHAPDELERAQVGYALDPEGRSLASREEGAWQPEWVVIGYTPLVGDPIIVDLGEARQPVSYLMHGMGEWGAGSYIAGSIGQLQNALKKVNRWIAEKKGQGQKQGQEDNRKLPIPVTRSELDKLVAEIVAEDEYADVEIWRMILAPAYDAAETYEEDLIGQVRSLLAQGNGIQEIAALLQIPIKQAYGYYKRSRS